MPSRAFKGQIEQVWPMYIQAKEPTIRYISVADAYPVQEVKTWPSVKSDKLEKVMIDALSYVVEKGKCKVGETVVVIPADSIVNSTHPWFTFLRNRRVRKAKYLGVMSHGLVIPNEDEKKIRCESYFPNHSIPHENNLDAWFQVERWLSPELLIKAKEIFDHIDECNRMIDELLEE